MHNGMESVRSDQVENGALLSFPILTQDFFSGEDLMEREQKAVNPF